MRVSVIIPCYNAAPYLGQVIGSALAQSRPPDEVIVVDDGSTDGSRAVAEGFGGRVHVLSHRSGNAPATRNLGASTATGDALMFLDADDVLGPTAVEALTRELERHPESVVACPWFRLDLRDGRWVRRPPSCAPRRSKDDALAAWLRGWYHPPCSVLWSRVAFERTGGWDPRATVNNDGDIMMRAFVLGVPLHHTADGEAFYRRLPEGEVSLSGTRHTEGGLRARIWVVERIAQMLEERGRLDPYRDALGVAFGRIAIDCGSSHPGLARACAEHRRRYGVPVWKRVVQSLQRRGRVGVGRVLRTAAPPPKEGRQGPLEEIRFGLDDVPPPPEA